MIEQGGWDVSIKHKIDACGVYRCFGLHDDKRGPSKESEWGTHIIPLPSVPEVE
jgi:hypothetical protein